MKDTVSALETMLAPLCADHGLELWAVEVAGSGGRPLVRVLIDREGGILLDDIAEANAWIGEALDSGDELKGPYVLEVSSPGIERPLRRPAHFAKFIGERARVKTAEPIEGVKSFTGTIVSAGDDAFAIDVDGVETSIGYENVSKAHLSVDFDFSDEGSRA